MRRALVAVCFAGVLASPPLYASPKVSLAMPREAYGTWNLGTAVFAPGQGDCAQPLVERMIQMLGKHQVVAGPVNLSSVIAEHRLKFPTFLKAADVSALGKHLGADTLFLVRMSQCTYPESSFTSGHPTGWLGIEDTKRWVYTTRTHASLSGTIQLLDLKGGKILKPVSLEASPEVVRSSEDSYPSAAPAEKVQAEGFDSLVSQVEILFFPWTEKRELVFYDDKDCDLKQAYALMKSGDIKGGLELSRKNNEQCKANPKRGEKERRKAAHNLATALYAAADYENALALFEEALRLGGGDDQKQGIEYCKWKLERRDAVRQLDTQVAAATVTP